MNRIAQVYRATWGFQWRARSFLLVTAVPPATPLCPMHAPQVGFAPKQACMQVHARKRKLVCECVHEHCCSMFRGDSWQSCGPKVRYVRLGKSNQKCSVKHRAGKQFLAVKTNIARVFGWKHLLRCRSLLQPLPNSLTHRYGTVAMQGGGFIST